jgi:anti-sigma B factor antagonist
MTPPTTTDVDGVLVVRFTDARLLNEVPSLWSREGIYREVQARPNPLVVVDLGAIDYISSLGIGALVGLKRRTDQSGGRLVLAGVQPYVVDVLHGMTLDKILPITPDLPSAFALLASFRSS